MHYANVAVSTALVSEEHLEKCLLAAVVFNHYNVILQRAPLTISIGPIKIAYFRPFVLSHPACDLQQNNHLSG